MRALDTAIGTGLGMVTAGWQDRRQLKQQEKLQGIQLEGQKELGKFNQGLALETFEKTGYEAQRKQMEKAGLNVGLMYEGGGAGGTTQGGQAGNVSGGIAPSGGGEIGMGINAIRQMAEIEAIKAQTKKTEAEIPKVETETKLLSTEIENVNANIKNTETKTKWQELQNEIGEATKTWTIDTAKELWYKANGEAQSAQAKGHIDTNTKDEWIKITELQLIGTQLNNDAIKEGIALTGAQIKKISEDIAQGWRKLEIEAEQQKTNKEQLEINKKELARKTIETEFGTGTGAQTERISRIAKNTAEAAGEFIPTKIKTSSQGQKDNEGGWWQQTNTTKSK